MARKKDEVQEKTQEAPEAAVTDTQETAAAKTGPDGEQAAPPAQNDATSKDTDLASADTVDVVKDNASNNTAHDAASKPAVATSVAGSEDAGIETVEDDLEDPDYESGKNVDKDEPKPESLSVLADRYRVPAWQQAALARFMGWVEGKMVFDQEYVEALEALKNRRIGGGRK